MQGQEAMDWATNLTALGAVLIVFVWLITKAIPTALETFGKSLDKQRESHVETLKVQRDDFRSELASERERSHALIAEGHAAVRELSQSVGELRGEVHRIGDCLTRLNPPGQAPP